MPRVERHRRGGPARVRGPAVDPVRRPLQAALPTRRPPARSAATAGDLGTMDLKEILKIPSVGKSIGEKIDEFVRTGTFEALEELRAQIPPGVREHDRDPRPRAEEGDRAVPGPRDRRRRAARRGRGAGPARRPEGVRRQDRGEHPARYRAHEPVHRRACSVSVAMDLADYFLERLGARRDVRRIEYAGSLRRMAETIGDLDLLVASDGPGGRDGCVRVGRDGRTRARQGRHEVVDPHAARVSRSTSASSRSRPGARR